MHSTVGPQLIVSTETGGLGNRIKSWVSATRLSSEAAVHWAVNDNMPASFSDLFSNDCGVDTVPAAASVHKSWRLLVLPPDEPYLPAGFATVGAGAHPIVRGFGKAWWQIRGQQTDRYRYMIFPKQHSRRSTRADGRHIDLEYGRIPKYFREIYDPLFRAIQVRPDILSRVDSWAGANLDPQTIGVQVRTWRDDPRRHRKYHQPAVKRLHRLMNTAGAEARFFFVSDSGDFIRSMQQAYGNRVIGFPRDTDRDRSWQSVEGMTEDLIDMLLLSRTKRLFASYLSTFSETAWWLGGTTAEVEVF